MSASSKSTEKDCLSRLKHIYIPASSLSSEKLLVANNYLQWSCGSLGAPMAARTVGSLPVANVQALAETCNGFNDKIPERYIRTEARSEEVVTGHGSTLAIPVIDLNKLLDSQSSEEECVKLVSACQNWGFFQLTNPGVPDDVIENMMNDVAEFFRQPLEAKKAYSQLPNSLEGYGQSFVVSDIQKLDWCDRFFLHVRPVESRDFRFWPTNPASFRHSVDVYSSEVAKLSCCLLEFMAKGMGAEPASLLGMFEGQPQGMRMNYYPPCWQADQVLGLSPHSDACGLTLLLQNRDVQGLQVKRDGKWFAVEALDGALIVNVGDTLEILSNGKFRSAEHRAVIHQNKERISVATFEQHCQDLIVGPLPEFVKGDKVRYRSTSYQDFLTQYLKAKLDGKNHLEKLKL